MFRFEKKFIINRADSYLLKHRLSNVMDLDSNVSSDGSYNIRSIYLDDRYDTSLHQVIAGISTREKYRIRIYNSNSSIINLEKKFKQNNMTSKVSCRLTMEEFNCIITGENLSIDAENHDLLNEMYFGVLLKGYKPRIVIDYDRVPFVYTAGNVRITIDENVAVGTQFNKFFNKEQELIPILDQNQVILEVKYDEFIPDYIRFALQLNKLNWTSFSKYGYGRVLLNKEKILL